MARGVMLAPASRMGRRNRNPQHPFQLRQRPFSIQPFLIAPVLPGETMKNLSLLARVVSDPVKNPLVGWWCEYYIFYIKHRDLGDRAQFEQMMLDPSWDDAAVDSQSTVRSHYYDGAADGINWVDLCLKRICDGAGAYGAPVTYFRNTGEAWNIATNASDSLPKARAFGVNAFDSLRADASMVADDIVLDTSDDEVTASEIDQALKTWSMLSEAGITDMTYEDYLRTFGTTARKEELHVPELLRFVRKWSYPSNTVDPETGAPSSALSWSIQETAAKDRFFKEPGFIFGVSVVRPKVYHGTQKATLSSQMNTLESWLPAVLADSPISSFKTIPDNGLLGNINDSGGAAFDVKDLLLYGEQFVNFQPGVTPAPDASMVDLPSGTLARWYPSDANIKALWTDQDVVDPAYTATRIYVRQDGIVSLSIAGRQMDTSITRPV